MAHWSIISGRRHNYVLKIAIYLKLININKWLTTIWNSSKRILTIKPIFMVVNERSE